MTQETLNMDFILFILFVFLVLMALMAYFAFSLWKGKETSSPSPYTGLPLRHAAELTYTTKDAVLSYLLKLHDFDNQMFDLDKAALCRETGRIFPNAVSWLNSISLDWSFLQRRYPGNYVSWGSLSEELKKELRDLHSLQGYQTEFSSSNPSPRLIVPEEFAFKRPGPLYVDLDSKVLLGWKAVPGTELEVLIVQKPRKISLINIDKKA